MRRSVCCGRRRTQSPPDHLPTRPLLSLSPVDLYVSDRCHGPQYVVCRQGAVQDGSATEEGESRSTHMESVSPLEQCHSEPDSKSG